MLAVLKNQTVASIFLSEWVSSVCSSLLLYAVDFLTNFLRQFFPPELFRRVDDMLLITKHPLINEIVCKSKKAGKKRWLRSIFIRKQYQCRLRNRLITSILIYLIPCKKRALGKGGGQNGIFACEIWPH